MLLKHEDLSWDSQCPYGKSGATNFATPALENRERKEGHCLRFDERCHLLGIRWGVISQDALDDPLASKYTDKYIHVLVYVHVYTSIYMHTRTHARTHAIV